VDDLTVIVLAVGLGMDAMSVCMAVGVRWHGRRQRARLAAAMGGAQFVMPLIGWVLGRRLAGLLSTWGRYVAVACLVLIGAKMLVEALRSRPGATAEAIEHEVERDLRLDVRDPTTGWSLALLALATSLDALAAGVSLGVRESTGSIWQASLIIGAVAAAMALAGVLIGRRLGRALGRPAEALGGLVLIGLGVAFLWR